MSDKINPNPVEASTHDAQLTAENMVAGNENIPQVDLDADYAASKEFSISEIDRTDEGAKAAAEAAAPQFEIHEPEASEFVAEPTGDSSEFMDMAKDVNPVLKADTPSLEDSGQNGDPAEFLEMAKEIKY